MFFAWKYRDEVRKRLEEIIQVIDSEMITCDEQVNPRKRKLSEEDLTASQKKQKIENGKQSTNAE